MITTGLFDKNYTNNQPYNHGWNTIPAHEYHGYASSSAERMPSLVMSDFPQYQNVRMIFNNNITYEDETPHGMNRQSQSHYFAPQVHKKVHFVEQEKLTEFVDPKSGKNEVRKESVDEQAESFIMLKHKKFELSKWDTFKGV